VLADDRVSDAYRHEDISRALAFSAGGDGGRGLLEHQEPCRDGKVKAPQRS